MAHDEILLLLQQQYHNNNKQSCVSFNPMGYDFISMVGTQNQLLTRN